MMTEISEWLRATAPAIGNHLWQTTAFATAVWMATLALRKNQARVRYGLWLAASVKFLVPFALLVAVGGMLPKPQRVVAAPAIYASVDDVAEPFVQMDYTPVAVPVKSWKERVEEQAPMALGVVWLGGVLTVLVMWAVRWRQVAGAVRRAERVEGGREFELLRRVERAMGMRVEIALRISQESMEPGIFGIVRPLLLWPERLSERLDDQHIEAILIHELAHARRRDNLTAALHMFVEAAFWFHPLVWWMERRMVEERERACDEAVVAMGSGPEVYADGLLKAVRFCVESPLTCVAGITGADLKDRVVKIMTARTLGSMTLGKKLALAVAGLAAVAVPIVLGQANGAARIAMDAVQPGGNETFEVASVRQVPDGPGPIVIPSIFPHRSGDRLTWTTSLGTMMSYAYQLPYWRITGIDNGFHFYTIVATLDPSASEEQVRHMLRTLLVERFRIVSHTETKDIQGYAMVVAKNGSKLKTANTSDQVPPMPDCKRFRGESRIFTHYVRTGAPTILGCGVTASDLAVEISSALKVPITDRTGLTGKYYFSFEFQSPDPPVDGADAPSIFSALPDELGLKLVKQKVSAELLVVDHLEKPSIDGSDVVAAPMAAPAKITLPDTPPSLDDMKIGPAFEVATIRPANRNDGRTFFGTRLYPSGRLICSTVGLDSLVRSAYVARPGAGMVNFGPDLPGWMKDETFDINAKVDAAYMDGWDKLSETQRMDRVRPMIRALLADRFHLKLRTEMRDMPVYALVQSKGGAKLKEVPAPPPPPVGGDPADAIKRQMAATSATPGNTWCDATTCSGNAAPVSRLLGQLRAGGWVDRTVIDRTGLTGYYDFSFTRPTTNFAVNRPPASDNETPPFVLIGEDLGLKFEPTKVPVTAYVIVSADKPSLDGAEVMASAVHGQGDAAQGKASTAAGAEYVPTMTFDVASIREAKIDLEQPHMVGGSFNPWNSSTMRLGNVPISWLLAMGYAVHDPQILGAPDWVLKHNDPIFNIEAKGNAAEDARLATLTKEQVNLEHEHMVQALLAERFNFKAHWETHEGPVLNLVAVKGSKLHSTAGGHPSAEALKRFGDGPIAPLYQKGDGGLGYEYVAQGCSMADLAETLALHMHERVVDKTGLTGKYDFDLKYSQKPEQERTPTTWPSLNDAVEDQLGLKLEEGKGPTRVLVVDRIERPSAN